MKDMIKFIELVRPLLFELVRYQPLLLYVFPVISKSIRSRITSDMSFVYYFLEEQFGIKEARELTLTLED
jgi:hypothetical protein